MISKINLKTFLLGSALLLSFFAKPCLAISLPELAPAEKPETPEEEGPQPIIVNGDSVEYSTESKEFSASGNVIVVYKGSKLSCEKLTLNSATKECRAEGRIRLEDTSGLIQGERMTYNFETKKGIIYECGFKSNPFYGVSQKLAKVSDREFVSYRGYLTTCNFKDPHWRMKQKKVNFFPGDKVQIKDNTVYIGKAPLMNIPRYNHSLKDPLMRVQLMPGTSKEWGPFLLTAWRYQLTEDLKGRIYLDYRSNFGIAEGLATNYDTVNYGKGDFKLYYTQERDKSDDVNQEDVSVPKVFERYLIRLRHKWDIDETTNFVSEYYKIVDSKRALMGPTFNLLKDYFPREYDKDTTPLSYLLFHRSFQHASLDVLVQKRVNSWYSQEEKLPQINFTLPSVTFWNTPLYLENTGSFSSTKYKYASPADNDDRPENKGTTTNRFTLPLKVAFFRFSPFVSSSQTFSDKGSFGSTITNIFSGGADVSTKFYRVFDVKTNFLKLDINGLRHVITPTATYNYSNNTSSKINEWNIGGDSAIRSSEFVFALENRLQTKRSGQTFDLAYFKVDSGYDFRTSGRNGQLKDVNFDLEVLPYRWLSFYADAKFLPKQYYFDTVNLDVYFNIDAERKFGLGQRYKLKGNNEFTYQCDWRLNPKWKVSFYHRLNMGSETAGKNGLREQEYVVSRDLHCWSVNLSYNTTRGKGDAIWLTFKIKAFPEMELELFNKSYHERKPGSQSGY